MSAQPKAFKAACVQLTSANEVEPNVATSSALIRDAAGKGADFVLMPEMVSLLEQNSKKMFERVVPQGDDKALKAYRAIAHELSIWLLVGSLPILIEEGKVANRSFLLDDTGGIRATYDKIHLFDVDLPNGERYRESKNYVPGGAANLAETPWGKLGMSVCYDLRFPHLYRAYGQAGADFLSIPAAFTKVTGEAHWHVLQRARAIENGCFVFAPAQCGTHADGRTTFGHSLIVDPWGAVLADGGTEPGVIIAEIDPARVAEARGRIPSLRHDRAYARPEPAGNL
jgi:deaminated glutathione amidase